MAVLGPRVLPGWVSAEALAVAFGVGALAVAHGAQAAGLVPCALCYLERWPYRVAIVLGLVALLWAAARPALRPLLILAFVAAAALGLVHAGVEWHWWKSPLPECAAPVLRMGNIRDMLASMPARPAKPCDDPTYLIPWVPISMAQLNMLYALVAAWAVGSRMEPRGARRRR